LVSERLQSFAEPNVGALNQDRLFHGFIIITGLKSLALPTSILRLNEQSYIMPGALLHGKNLAQKALKNFAGQTHLSWVKYNYRHCPISMPVVDYFFGATIFADVQLTVVNPQLGRHHLSQPRVTMSWGQIQSRFNHKRFRWPGKKATESHLAGGPENSAEPQLNLNLPAEAVGKAKGVSPVLMKNATRSVKYPGWISAFCFRIIA
jgi:hypothetical protein